MEEGSMTTESETGDKTISQGMLAAPRNQSRNQTNFLGALGGSKSTIIRL